MSNYWLDLIRREEEIEKLRREKERREIEIAMREYLLDNNIRLWKDAQRKKK